MVNFTIIHDNTLAQFSFTTTLAYLPESESSHQSIARDACTRLGILQLCSTVSLRDCTINGANITAQHSTFAAVKNDADSRQAQLGAWHEGVTKLTYHVSGRTQ